MGLCPHIKASGQCFYLHKHEVVVIIRQAIHKLELNVISEEILLPCNKTSCPVALKEIVKELVDIFRITHLDGRQPNKLPTFLLSLRREQNDPALFFGNQFSTIFKSPSKAHFTPILTTEAATYDSLQQNLVENSDDQIDLSPWMPVSDDEELTNFLDPLEDQIYLSPPMPGSEKKHDQELDAIDEEARKLRAKLKFLEDKKAKRTHQLLNQWGSDPIYFHGYLQEAEAKQREVNGNICVGIESEISKSTPAILQDLVTTNPWFGNDKYVV